MERVTVIQGNEACVRGAIAAGCGFFAGYPITPASEVAELMAEMLPRTGGVFIQMEDEIASICAVVGAAWGGAKACTGTSGPGFSLMQEAIGYAAATETPCVIINVQRGGPSTGMPTSPAQADIYQAKYGSHGDYEIIAYAPSSAQEAFDLTIKAFNAAEKYRVPVFVMSDEVVGHTREKVRIPEAPEVVPRQKPSLPPGQYVPFRAGENGLLDGMPAFNQGYNLLLEGQLHDEWGNRAGTVVETSAALLLRLTGKVLNHDGDLTDVEGRYLDDADVVVLSYGSPIRPAMQAIRQAREKGIKAGALKLRIVWPFPDEVVHDLAGRVKKIIVPEMNVGKMVREVERAARGRCEVLALPKLGGALHTPADILAAIEGRR
ncbi:MAG TPA: 2-oxoacid:acceptor oxidoreductase subunit alpha [Chloroflexota bacterium]|nr:2-oxoacid:acceptor oxidoreductase subunit alpha [Chloroflexota bacterium]